jgi:hypothetical protein
MGKLVTGDGTKNSDMGPLVTKQHRDKVASYVEAGIKEGATAVVDGRNVQADGAKDGYWLGPTLFDNVKSSMSIYKEDIQFNDESGELSVNGQPKIQFYKNYLMPKGALGTPNIEPLNTVGPNLNDPAPLAYFFDKLVQESKIPFSRFQGPDGGSIGKYANSAEGLDKEEIRFAKFIMRLRSIFQDILIKPLWIQLCRDFPQLEKDYMFRSQLGLTFISDNPFRVNQEIETMNKRKESIDAMYQLVDGEGQPFFSLGYLIENFLGMTEDDIRSNEEAKEKTEKKKKKSEPGEEGGEEAGAAPGESPTPPAGPEPGGTPPETETPE